MDVMEAGQESPDVEFPASERRTLHASLPFCSPLRLHSVMAPTEPEVSDRALLTPVWSCVVRQGNGAFLPQIRSGL